MKWVELEESFTWVPDMSGPEESAHRYEDGRTLRELYPNQYKLIPDVLFLRLQAARNELQQVETEIDAQ